jgi:hypothetical protein
MAKRSVNRRRAIWGATAAIVVVFGALGYVLYDNLFKVQVTRYDDIEELMKYGSIGAEKDGGLPYPVWRAMPAVCSNDMPAGYDPKHPYSAFGLVYEEGHEEPIGLTRERIGFERSSLSCAACHLSHYRETPTSKTTYYSSGTNISFDGQRYSNFLFACARNPAFTSDNVVAEIEKVKPLGPVERLLYKHLIVPGTKDGLAKIEKRFSWWYKLPLAGPGRWIAFGDLKRHFAQQPDDGSIGNPDVPTMWNLKHREQVKQFHWDGLTDTIDKAMQNAAVGAGANKETIRTDNLNRLRDWWMTQPPPKYPMPIDAALAKAGEQVWATACASCHQIGTPTAGRIIPINEIGTDRWRYDLVTAGTVEGYNRRAREMYGWPQDWFIRKTEGFVAVLLDAVWLRAPYLHNGAVPTIADLLEPPANRPKVFYRGHDVYDQQRLGYVSSGPEAEKHFRYDTSLPGNGNGGHAYGTDLPADQKKALIEFLKTL